MSTKRGWASVLRPKMAALLFLFFPSILPGETGAQIGGEAPRRQPGRFAIIFNMGYAGDHLPKDPVRFEAMVKTLKEAHFNTIWGQWDPKRGEICHRHDMQMFVDLLTPDHHVFHNVEGSKSLCESLRRNPDVFGYHLWSDIIGKTAAGRTRDVRNVHLWDDSHPVYVGTYKMGGMAGVEDEDIFGYYDFHWKRGGHWSHLNQAFNLVKNRQIPFFQYADPLPGLVGKGNVNRIGYTLATSAIFGLRGYSYHYKGGVLSPEFDKLDALGLDQAAANAKMASVGAELMQIGLPTAVYSSAVTMDANGRPLAGPSEVPGGIPSVPKDSWFQIRAGEVVVSTCRDAQNRDVICFASHNAYLAQEVKLALSGVEKVECYDRAQGAWKPLPSDDHTASFKVDEGAVELIRTRLKRP